MTTRPAPSARDRFRGCLLGGAVGDALGAPVEFLRHSEIVARFGEQGIRNFAPAYGRFGAITDDTQMTLFTAEGLIRAAVRYANKGICNPITVIHRAYLRWLGTQGETPTLDVPMDGWLATLPALWSQRAPGVTCLSALRAATELNTPAQNDSKGCGAVMRTAPIGLTAGADRVFDMAIEAAALTHGHPSGKLSAGFVSILVSKLVEGRPLVDAVEAGKDALRIQPDHLEVLMSIDRAQALAAGPRLPGDLSERLGGGWVAEEAVAVSLYCALVSSSFRECVLLAVNQSGDSDSTGAIAGNIAGALYGVDAIPADWLDQLELRDEITAMADDLLGVRQETLELQDRAIWDRYPGL
jgi:ADP-ribosyl-[dinitrogen reductase] hydrolase